MGWYRHELLWNGMRWDRKICPMDKREDFLHFIGIIHYTHITFCSFYCEILCCFFLVLLCVFTFSLCLFAEEMQTQRPCKANGCNSGLLHIFLVTVCFVLFLSFYYRLLISDNKTSKLKTKLELFMLCYSFYKAIVELIHFFCFIFK